MDTLPTDQPKIIDHVPTALGRAALDVCLSAFPLALATVNLVGSITGKYVSMRNEQQVTLLLEKLKEKIERLESADILSKEQLKQNPAYHEIAHKRLLTISALDPNEDIELSACLIAVCGMLTGADSKDRHLLGVLGDISPDEVRLFLLGKTKADRFAKLKSEFDDLERRDAQIEKETSDKVSIEFFNEGQSLLGLSDFDHLLGRLQAYGLIAGPGIGGFSEFRGTPRVYPIELTSMGDYLVALLETCGPLPTPGSAS